MILCLRWGTGNAKLCLPQLSVSMLAAVPRFRCTQTPVSNIHASLHAAGQGTTESWRLRVNVGKSRARPRRLKCRDEIKIDRGYREKFLARRLNSLLAKPARISDQETHGPGLELRSWESGVHRLKSLNGAWNTGRSNGIEFFISSLRGPWRSWRKTTHRSRQLSVRLNAAVSSKSIGEFRNWSDGDERSRRLAAGSPVAG